MSPDENKRVIRRYIDELNRRDVAILDELVSAGFRDVVRSGYEQEIETYPDYHVTVHDMIAEGDQVVVEWSHTGTQRGSYYGVPPSNREIVGHAISIYRVRDGRITGARGMWDRGEIWQQLGLIPPTDEILPDDPGSRSTP
jgi:steroid delta-isomerase-like uncharacterized protein